MDGCAEKGTDPLDCLDFAAPLDFEESSKAEALTDDHHAAGDLGSAEAHYREALALAPDSAELRVNLAAVLAETAREDEAGKLLNALLQRDPEQRNALAVLAELQRRRGDEQGAEETQQRLAALEQAPGR